MNALAELRPATRVALRFRGRCDIVDCLLRTACAGTRAVDPTLPAHIVSRDQRWPAWAPTPRLWLQPMHTVKTVIFLIAGKLDCHAVKPHAR